MLPIIPLVLGALGLGYLKGKGDSLLSSWFGNNQPETPAISNTTLIISLSAAVVALAYIKQLKGLFK